MTADPEFLRHVWRERLDKLVEELAGPLDYLRAAVGAETDKERIVRAAADIERGRLEMGLKDAGQPKPRRDPLWAWRKRTR